MSEAKQEIVGSLKILREFMPQLLLFLVVCSVMLFSMSRLADPSRLPIVDVKISGAYQHVSSEELQSAVLPYVSKGFLALDVHGLWQQLQDIPWIDTVRVRREWPNGVSIHFTEQQALARWESDGVLNSSGELFHPDISSIPDGLPTLVGPSDQSRSVFQTYQDVQRLLNKLEMTVVAVQVSPRRSWQIKLYNGMTIILGRREVVPRVERLVKVWPKLSKKEHNNIRQIDLRFPNGFAAS